MLSIYKKDCIQTSVGCIADASTILTPVASPSVSSLHEGRFLLGWKEKVKIKSGTFISVTSEIEHG